MLIEFINSINSNANGAERQTIVHHIASRASAIHCWITMEPMLCLCMKVDAIWHSNDQLSIKVYTFAPENHSLSLFGDDPRLLKRGILMYSGFVRNLITRAYYWPIQIQYCSGNTLANWRRATFLNNASLLSSGPFETIIKQFTSKRKLLNLRKYNAICCMQSGGSFVSHKFGLSFSMTWRDLGCRYW